MNRYGSLTLLQNEGKARDKHKCRCDCGAVCYVRLNQLRQGQTKSCGCLRRRIASKTFRKHGKTRTPEYTSWQLMKDRCYNKNNKIYSYYGGAGIAVCDRWINSFDVFLSDMGEKPGPSYTLDRIDGTGNYCPENCRWATRLEQSRNRKNTIRLSLNGEIKSIGEWCDVLGIKYAKAYKRFRMGWPTNKILEKE